MHSLYAAFIADGYCYEISDDEEAADSSYWLSLKLSERDCPVCQGNGDEHEGCGCCGGCGVVTGEPFTLIRFDFNNEEERNAAIEAAEDAGDGYDRAGVLVDRSIGSADILEWSPEEDGKSYRLCPCCRVYRIDDGDDWRVCPDCQDTINYQGFRDALDNGDRRYDPWGFVMAWGFALAGEAYCRGILTAELTEARYRPGLLAGRIDPDSQKEVTAAAMTDDAIAKGWRLLSRYAAMVERAGRSY